MERLQIKSKKSEREKIDVNLIFLEYMEDETEIKRKEIHFISRSGLYLDSNERYRNYGCHSGRQVTICDIGMLQHRINDCKNTWFIYSYPDLENEAISKLIMKLKYFKNEKLKLANKIPTNL